MDLFPGGMDSDLARTEEWEGVGAIQNVITVQINVMEALQTKIFQEYLQKSMLIGVKEKSIKC